MGNGRLASYLEAIDKAKNLTLSRFYDKNIFMETSFDYEIVGMTHTQVQACAQYNVIRLTDKWKSIFNGKVFQKNDKIYLQIFVDLNHLTPIKEWLLHKFNMCVDFKLPFNNKKITFDKSLLKWIQSQGYEAKITADATTNDSNISIKSMVEFK